MVHSSGDTQPKAEGRGFRGLEKEAMLQYVGGWEAAVRDPDKLKIERRSGG